MVWIIKVLFTYNFPAIYCVNVKIQCYGAGEPVCSQVDSRGFEFQCTYELRDPGFIQLFTALDSYSFL